MRLRSSARPHAPAAGEAVLNPALGAGMDGEPSSLGQMLVADGIMSEADVQDVLRHQERSGGRFADAAVALGKVDQNVLQQALSQQADFPVLALDDPRVDPRVVAAFDPNHSFVVDIRAVRSELSSRWRGDGPDDQRALAVIAQDSSVDVSLIVANLAVVSAQLGWRTLLVDADLETSVQHELFRSGNAAGLSTVLQGGGATDQVVQPTAIERLSILPAGPIMPNAFELLEKQPLLTVLDQLGLRHRLIVAGLSRIHDVHLGALDLVFEGFDGVVIVVRRNVSSLRSLQKLTDALTERDLPILGIIVDE